MIRGRFLGKGSSKQVFQSEHDGRTVAVLSGCSEKEVELMERLSSEYVVRVLCRLPENMIMTDLAEHGSLIDLQDSLEFDSSAVSSDHITFIVLQVQLALNAIWDLGYVHGDVAERNVLVFAYDECAPCKTKVKLGDLGEARESGSVQEDVDSILAMNLRLRRAWDAHLQNWCFPVRKRMALAN